MSGAGGETDRDRTRRQLAVFVALIVMASLVGTVVLIGSAQAADVAVVSVTSTPDRPTVYDDVRIEASVTNPESSDEQYIVDRLVIREGADPTSDVVEREDTSATVRPGTTGSVASEIDISESGTRTVYAHMRILTGGSGSVSVVRPVTFEVADPHPSLSLRASPIDAANRTTLSVNVVNGRETDLRGLSLEADADRLRIQEPRRVAGDLAGGETARFEFTGVEATPGPETVDVSMSYVTADGDERETTTTLQTDLQPRQNPAEIVLTGTQIAREDGRLVVRGEASNVGGSNASGVRIGVDSADGVSPAQNQATFFVGSVEADEYKRFTVNAAVENLSAPVTVPLRIDYTVDGVSRSQTVELGYSSGGQSDDDASGGAGPTGVAGIAGVLVVVLIGLGALYGVYRYRSRDDGDA
ncbi:hypothetical protein HARCEL1_08905 [Halococcoides cellulosivorans]|uniref:CARDB domain-containing protein n=2 Tax=Halococcoides cellulosivorans TaxID=1679096 RepID=A0A2R4X1Y9_9EURY|nr:hypothetical protein HARCEL1_08905 [Halococcoides cellulosivorans]